MPRRKRRRKKSAISKFQRRVAGLVRLALNDNYVRYEVSWDWLINKEGNKLYVDAYFPNWGLAVEAHGIQHFKFPNFFHKTYQEYLHQRANDRTKAELLKARGIKLLVIKCEPEPTEKRIKKALDQMELERPLVGNVKNREYTDVVERRIGPNERILPKGKKK